MVIDKDSIITNNCRLTCELNKVVDIDHKMSDGECFTILNISPADPKDITAPLVISERDFDKMAFEMKQEMIEKGRIIFQPTNYELICDFIKKCTSRPSWCDHPDVTCVCCFKATECAKLYNLQLRRK